MDGEKMLLNYPLVCKKLWGCFCVKMKLNNSLHSVLDANGQNYDFKAEEFESQEFWANTQFLIYRICGVEESLMGILFNKLKKKISLHFECGIGEEPILVDYEPDSKSLRIKVNFEETACFNDSYIYEDSDNVSHNNIAELVRYGYDNAKKERPTEPKDCIENARICIDKTVEDIFEQVKQMPDGFLSKEPQTMNCDSTAEQPKDTTKTQAEYEDFKHLLKVALAYCFPTNRFKRKRFSALTDVFYTINEGGEQEELSCGGEFIIWNPETDLEPLFDRNIVNTTDINELALRFQFAKFQNEILLEAARETSSQMTNIIKKESIKSAKAAIMSRNLSHNLGSHVMSYLKQNFNSVQDIVANGTLKTVIEPGDEKRVRDKDELPLLVGMGKFISYLQERQDYIATVSTDYIPCPSVVNFKDAIYDELNPDYRFYRHKDNWSGHKPANILLQNIAKSEGLSRELLPVNENDIQRENNILIQYRSFDGLKEKNKEEALDFDNLRKWNFSLPGGVMGRQAVFSIVENIIRNSAKHGSRQDGENLKITFDIQDADDELDTEYSDAVDKSDLYIVTLTDNVKTADIDNIIDDINVVINTSFYEEGTDLTASNKGIKEMIISAAWLRGIRIEEQNEGEKTAPILRARKSKDGFLQYVFCLPKVKKVAYLTNDKKTLDRNTKELNRLGWYLFDVNKYLCLSNRSFNFILLDQSLLEQREEIRKCSNNRLFVVLDKTNFEKREIEFNIDNVLKHFESLENGEPREKYLKEMETKLFAQMALSRNDEDVRIAISDANTGINGIQSDKVRLYGKESNITEYKYIYRTHNDSTKDFLGFLNTLKKGGDLKTVLDRVEFVEGITGGNSTDRIVRREVKDELWMYQQIHAMKTKIAVFDERIFTRITGYETSRLKEEKERIDWSKALEGISLLEKKQNINNYDFKRKKRITDSRVFFKEWSEDDVIRFANDNYPFKDAVGMNVKRVLPLVYHKKGIDIFTLTKTNDENNRFAVWAVRDNLSDLVTDPMDDGYKNNIYGRIEKVAELYFEDNTPKITFLMPETEDNDFKHYDYVTIHQGLLDKIYQKMPVKDLTAKRAVTKEISDKFIKGECNLDNYLPGLMIHSGRSRPNRKDMPQNQPFIQYSAIENAVLDCKYTLVELLDFASYE